MEKIINNIKIIFNFLSCLNEKFIILDDKINEKQTLNSNYNFISTKKNNRNKNKNKLQKLILVVVLIFLKSNNDTKQYYLFNKIVNNETVQLINLNFTKKQYKIKGLEFLNKIKRNKLNNITKQFKHPKISIIIPIYKCEKTIELSIKSINYQNLKELEIILVNDFSPDNSSLVIKKMNEFDKRIKIINNKKNMGTLYSRSIGALKSKGEYIIGIDNDDFFSYENILETVYLNSKINDFDIVEIKSLNIPNYYPKYKQIRNGNYIYHPNNLILHQPELGLFSITYNNKLAFRDHFAWGKCIKNRIYKKAVNRLGYKRYSTYNCWTEDMSIVFVLFNTAKSYIFLNVFGIFRIKAKTTTTHKLPNIHKFLSYIFYLGILFDFSKNDIKTKSYIVEYAKSFSYNRINKLDDKNKFYFKSIIKKIIESPFISKENKIKIKQKFHF